jgi:hypothetical protein
VVSAGCDLSDVVRGVPTAVCESKRFVLGIDRNEAGPPARSSLPAIDGRSKDIVVHAAALGGWPCVVRVGVEVGSTRIA